MSLEPTIDAERFALFRLSLVEGLGPVRLRRLLDRFGSPSRVLSAGADELRRVEQIGPQSAAAVRTGSSEEDAQRAYERMARLGVRLVFESDSEYPPGLREIPDGPLVLSLRGEIVPADRLAVAIVGARRCTVYGRRMAERLAAALAARGLTIVSGLARGIDAAAHQAALRAGGRTIAVLASGLAHIYPPEHSELAEEVVRQGALISEAPLDGLPLSGVFPQRNRIISGMSLGVVVVEAGARSGALITARHALEQNREVFAVPGRIGDLASEGANRLIQQGAFLVNDVDDVLGQLGPVELPAPPEGAQPEPADRPALARLDEIESKLWQAVGDDPVGLEVVLERTGLSVSEASASLLVMEMKRLVRRHPGNCYARV